MADENPNDALWRKILIEGDAFLHAERALYRFLPSDPRCSQCKAPFEGVGGAVLHNVFHIGRSSMNPTLCNLCENHVRNMPGGAEVDLTILFADIRGSTRIAQTMSPSDFSRLMDRFYTAATTVIVQTDGLIEKFIGDEVTVWYVPGFAGRNPTANAIDAGRKLLEITGHHDPNGPWAPLGVGIHHGLTFVGAVGSAGVAQFAALGDVPNTGARLASVAAAGEVLISDAAYEAAQLDLSDLEHRDLELKGRAEPLGVRVLTLSTEKI